MLKVNNGNTRTTSMRSVIVFFIAQKMKFSIKVFFNQCDQIPRKLWIWSHLLRISLMENFIFCAVFIVNFEHISHLFLMILLLTLNK